jgi:pentapeptide repeat protein
MSEQQAPTSVQLATSACPHPEAVGTRWGDPISEERQRYLQGYLDEWALETDHDVRRGPFHGEPLTGADVSWLAERVRNYIGDVPGLHLEVANLVKAHLEGVDLSKAHLEGALLVDAHLEGTDLGEVHLEEALLIRAHLEGVDLIRAHLEGVDLIRAHLEEANLTAASFDKASRLNEAVLASASFDQVTFDNTNLSVVDWKKVPILGDELTAQKTKDGLGNRKSRQQRIEDYQAAVRAYRRLAVALQANGLSAESANYLYRASIMERRLARHERRVGAYFFSVLLAVLAGYGYRLGRILIAYIVALVLFATAYFAVGMWLGATHLEWYDTASHYTVAV